MSENRATKQKKRFRPGQDIRRIFPLSLCVDLFCTLTILFFSPLEVYYGNVNQFLFSIGEIWWIMAGTAAVAAVIMTAVKCLFPRRVALILNAVTFGGTLCAYVQAMLLNGKMSSLTGEEVEYDLTTIIGDLAIWVLILAAVMTACVLLIRRRGEKGARTVRNALVFASLTLIVMQLTGFLTNFFSYPTVIRERYLSNEKQFELSEKDNTLVFIIDTLDGRDLEEARKKYPDIFDGLDGFTYYPDATSTHSRTYPSIPYLLTGELCYFDKPYTEYVKEAYEKSSYLEDIRKTGCSIGLYTDDQYVGDKGMDLIDNSADYQQHSVAGKKLIRQMTKIALFRDMPYAFKAPFVYDSAKVNKKIVQMADGLPARAIVYDDDVFYKVLRRSKLQTSGEYDRALRFYHFWGPHPGHTIDENVKDIGLLSTAAQSIRGDFKIIQEYISQMKALGIYERATIVITADHGTSVSDKRLEIDNTRAVAMLVKKAGTGNNGEGCQISEAPVAHTDLFATILESFGADPAEVEERYGRPIDSYRPGEQRIRYYYHTAHYSDIDGEVALREYKIDGDARVLANYHLTGRNWDVLYSERAVSKHRLSEVLDKKRTGQ